MAMGNSTLLTDHILKDFLSMDKLQGKMEFTFILMDLLKEEVLKMVSFKDWENMSQGKVDSSMMVIGSMINQMELVLKPILMDPDIKANL